MVIVYGFSEVRSAFPVECVLQFFCLQLRIAFSALQWDWKPGILAFCSQTFLTRPRVVIYFPTPVFPLKTQGRLFYSKISLFLKCRTTLCLFLNVSEGFLPIYFMLQLLSRDRNREIKLLVQVESLLAESGLGDGSFLPCVEFRTRGHLNKCGIQDKGSFKWVWNSYKSWKTRVLKENSWVRREDLSILWCEPSQVTGKGFSLEFRKYLRGD